MPADTYDSDPNSLPPLTKAIRQSWPGPTPTSAGTAAIASNPAMRAYLDAIHALELRLIALGG
jgi:hypothetical protein